jgi:hypothetical protein
VSRIPLGRRDEFLRSTDLVFPVAVVVSLVLGAAAIPSRDLWAGADCGAKFSCLTVLQLSVVYTMFLFGPIAVAGFAIARAYVQPGHVMLRNALASGTIAGMALSVAQQALVVFAPIMLVGLLGWFVLSSIVCAVALRLAVTRSVTHGRAL